VGYDWSLPILTYFFPAPTAWPDRGAVLRFGWRLFAVCKKYFFAVFAEMCIFAT